MWGTRAATSDVTTLLVTGASGTLGRALLASGRHRAHRVRAAARRIPAAPAHDDIQWRSLDLLTGAGLEAALAGAEVVVHAASAPRGESERTEVEGTRRLVDAAAHARVRHLIYVSIVGVDRIPVAYYRHKLAAEEIVRGASLPWTIVRGTQFFDLIDIWCGALAKSPIPIGMRGWKVQPIHVAEFADALWDVVDGAPQRRILEIAGPQLLTWPEVVMSWRAATGRRPFAVGLPIPGRLSRLMRDGAACAPGRAIGTLTWRDWLARKYGPGT